MGDIGFELPPKTPGKTTHSDQGGAKSGALGAPVGEIDADLAFVVGAWNQLPAEFKGAIVASVRRSLAMPAED